MNNLNSCSFIGNLGADPDIRRTQDGRPIASFNIACSQTWRDKNSGERKEKTEWVPIVIFSEGLFKVAEQYLRKGSKVYVQGRFQSRKWQDKDGNDRWITEIVLQGFEGKLEMLDRKSDGNSEPQTTTENPADFGGHADLDDEIPF